MKNLFGKRSNSDTEYVQMKDDKRYCMYSIGEYTYGQPKISTWNPNEKLTIGKFCSISENVIISLGGEHRTDWATTFPFNVLFKEFSQFQGHPKSKGNVEIGNDVWIGYGAYILSGVKIGDGAVVGAEAVVAKDVPPYAIVAGNPAKILRMRFPQETIEKMLQIQWWNWDIETIKKNMPFLLSNNIDEFTKKVSSESNST